jgi:hypothetical protein
MAEKKKIAKAATNGSLKDKAAGKTTKPRRKKKELSANELTLLAWQKTYENREKRLD